MTILGIDPGTTRIGYGVIRLKRAPELVAYGVVGDKTKTAPDRLTAIRRELTSLVRSYKPDAVGIEKVYFSKNKKTALSVAEARGVMILLLNEMAIPVFEFTPSNVKRVVAGDGSCDKKSLARIVAMTLNIDTIEGPDDASDALALALRTSFELLTNRRSGEG